MRPEHGRVPAVEGPAPHADASKDDSVCVLRGIGKRYAGQEGWALVAVDLQLARHEMVALVGASGSGKTTLLNILGLLDRPSAGTFTLDGERNVESLGMHARAALRQRKLAFAFQAFHLLPTFDALDNVALPLVYRGTNWAEARCMAQDWLARMGLAAHSNALPWQLSAGQRQRVGLARALACRPCLLLADEPTGNLDAETAASILQLLDDARRDFPLATLLVTHDPGIARRCDRVYRMDAGRCTRAA